jgi:hypothetical protein
MAFVSGDCRIFLQQWGKLKIIDLWFINLHNNHQEMGMFLVSIAGTVFIFYLGPTDD